MPRPYNITITNGTGSAAIVNGTYDVTANFNGYNNASILPTTETITTGVNTYDFTVAATGTLTLLVTDDGTPTGNPIVGATFYRTDSIGTHYGSVVTTSVTGEAIFPYVPFAASSAPLIYFVQTASDGDHEFDSSVQNTTMTTSTKTVDIINAPAALRTINLTDTNYAGLPIASGTLTLS